MNAIVVLLFIINRVRNGAAAAALDVHRSAVKTEDVARQEIMID